jgi:hypothetical protein
LFPTDASFKQLNPLEGKLRREGTVFALATV